MKTHLTIVENTEPSLSVCICDDVGIHYPCPTCGKYYNDEIDALICCLEDQEDF